MILMAKLETWGSYLALARLLKTGTMNKTGHPVMCSLLERIPRDVLENIAYLIATYDILGLPKDLLHLILTCSTFYHSLSISSAPHLYSRIYRTKYDTKASSHRASVDNFTDSAAATELVLRTRLLRRIRSNDMSKQGLSQDLNTALRMTLESEGLNEAQLHAVPFLPFLFVYVRLAAESGSTQQDSNLAVVLWLLALHTSKGTCSVFLWVTITR
jgi:hypothetical protein